MIKSMTGYGRGEYTMGKIKATVEMKSVNHRYLDITVRMNKKLGFLEQAIKSQVKQSINRGKLDIYVNYEDEGDLDHTVKINLPLLEDYLIQVETISKKFDIVNDLAVSHVIDLQDVLILESSSMDE